MPVREKISEIESLTGLRGFAAVFVCLVHYSAGDTGNFLYPFLSRGYWGVFVFFALSGFILAYVYQNWFTGKVDRASYARFLKIRLIRIYPLHLATLLSVLALTWIGIYQWGGVNNAYTLVLNLLLVQDWGFVSYLSWNFASWSISVEAFCYLLFPFLLIAARKTAPKAILPIFLACLAVLALEVYRGAITSALALFHIKMEPIGFGGYGINLCDSFLMFLSGMLAFFLIKDRKITQRQGDLSVLAGLAIMIFACLANLPHGAPTNALVTLAAVAIVSGLFFQGKIGNAIFANKAVFFLGTISYSLYMVHGLFRGCFESLQNIYLFPITWAQLPLVIRLGLAVLCAAAVHYAFDEPVRVYLRKLIAPKPLKQPEQPRRLEEKQPSLVG